MSYLLHAYARVAGKEAIDHLRQLSAPLKGAKFVHVNSTRVGGGGSRDTYENGPSYERAWDRYGLGSNKWWI